MLIVTAHPDDETFMVGGTAMRYARAGARVVLVHATMGEGGRCGDPPLCTPQELPRVRRAELAEACRLIGIDRAEFLGYRDGQLAHIPDSEGEQRVLAMLDRFRPQVVVTFPPGGLTGHGDHRAVQRWTLGAVRRWAAQAPAARDVRLYYFTHPEYLGVIGLEPRHPDDTRADVHIDIRSEIPAKIRALRCHRTQHLSAADFIAWLRRAQTGDDSPLACEHYLQAFPEVERGSGEAPRHGWTDLFEPPLLPAQGGAEG